MEIFRRRNRGKDLTLRLESAVDGFHGPVSPQVVEEGGELFENFMSSQIETDLPQLRPFLDERGPKQLKTTELTQTAARLRQLATSFSRTDERQQVREMAMEISSDISGEELGYLLLTMLTNSDHIEEGIVVIFFFCFDLVVRLLKSSLKSYWDIIDLCKMAIIKSLGPIVNKQGGWAHSIQSAAGNTMAMGILATGMMVVARLGLKALFNV